MLKSVQKPIARMRQVRRIGIGLYLQRSSGEIDRMLLDCRQRSQSSQAHRLRVDALNFAQKLHREFQHTKGASDRYEYQNQFRYMFEQLTRQRDSRRPGRRRPSVQRLRTAVAANRRAPI